MVAVEQCTTVVRRITALLNERREDVLEFKVTVNFVNDVLSEFARKPLRQVDLAHVLRFLQEYEALLTQLVTENRFSRFMTSNRIRKKLELTNSNLHTEVSNIFMRLRTESRMPVQRARDESVVRLLNALDPAAREMWENAFQDNPMVPWADFMHVYRETVRQPVNESGLRYLLDNSGTNNVNLYKFSEFLKGFGPLMESPHKVHEVVSADWFHGYLSSDEAARLLAQSDVNTYLVRISKSRLGAFALAYVKSKDTRNNQNEIIHTLISTAPPHGFKIDEQINNSAKDRVFQSLTEVVKFYSHMLKTPFNSSLARESWFHGDMQSGEATEMLRGRPDGTFLFRFSSYPGFLAVSYVERGVVQHGKVEVSPLGFRFETEEKKYLSLQHLVEDYRKLLKEPLSNTPFPNREYSMAGSSVGSGVGAYGSSPGRNGNGATHYHAVVLPQQPQGLGPDTPYAPLPIDATNSGRASPAGIRPLAASNGGSQFVSPSGSPAQRGSPHVAARNPANAVIAGYGVVPSHPAERASSPAQPSPAAGAAMLAASPPSSAPDQAYGVIPGTGPNAPAADGYGKIPNSTALKPAVSARAAPSAQTALAAGYGVIPMFQNGQAVVNGQPVSSGYGNVPGAPTTAAATATAASSAANGYGAVPVDSSGLTANQRAASAYGSVPQNQQAQGYGAIPTH